MKHNSNKTGKAKKQTGAVAIEFALMFPVFFAMVYAIIAYGMAFLIIQSFTYVSEDALRAALATECAESVCTQDELEPVVRSQVQNSLTWLSASLVSSATSGENFSFSCDPNMLCTVRLSTAPPLPGITLPLVGDIPSLPDSLVGRASLRL
ncbi:TadE-like protein [Spongiibacter sp. IMCC21906]|uniref:TadE/TadG family type IV pilus assembly protein n=1 Tax=Spongiibacter sp. IMCC21906 TaxID=1620392 RepID=UPI00062DF4CC|nr:TadE family protein [Spongiibacter sp. IMCC21906]AKH69590.1 TadE-like protein [Spongiibacter sp. IMCC21906]